MVLSSTHHGDGPTIHAPTYPPGPGSRICAVLPGMTVRPSMEVSGPYVPSPAMDSADSHESATTFLIVIGPVWVAPCGFMWTASWPFLQVTPSATMLLIGVQLFE